MTKDTVKSDAADEKARKEITQHYNPPPVEPVVPAKHGGSATAMMDNLIKEPAGPEVKLSPAPGDSQINPNLVAQVGEAGWTDPPQGKTVLAEKDGAPMLVQFKINSNTGPKGGFYSQMTPKGGFSCFEGKVDAWTEIPKGKYHRKAPLAA